MRHSATLLRATLTALHALLVMAGAAVAEPFDDRAAAGLAAASLDSHGTELA
jgi:hypothetical protein